MTVAKLQSEAAAVFEGLGGDLVDTPTLMPASVPLDLSGEAVRSRLCVFTDARGREIALRPDLTLPVALAEIDARQGGERAETIRRYVARAFRLPVEPGMAVEFTQVGFERFGARSEPDTDTAVFGTVLEAASVGAPPLGEIWLGDLAVFPSLVDAVTDDPATADALKRTFRQGVRLDTLGEAPSGSETDAIARVLSATSREDAETLIRHMLAFSGVDPVGERGFDEIVERLLAKAASGARTALPTDVLKLLRSVAQLSGPADRTTGDLARLVRKAGLSGLDSVIDGLVQRQDAISSLAKGAELNFATSFGRRFNYYDGFLFEVFAKGAAMHAPLAAGGRYDRLIADLSDRALDVTAIGGVVRPDRIALAAGAKR